MQAKVVGLGFLALGAVAVGAFVLIGGSDKDSNGLENTGFQQNQLGQIAIGDYDSSRESALQEPERNVPEPKAEQGSRGFDWTDMASRMTLYDADGDGILSDEEQAEMRRAMREQWMERLDLDGDGEISREERMAARQERFEQSERGQRLMRQFDADGDGQLNEEEQAAMDAYNEEQREERRQREVEQYDTDGDGELSRDERQVQREEQRARWEGMRDSATDEFDRDGDGQLNIEESQDAMNAWRERREIDQFVNQYDADGDGAMSASDYDQFVSDYGNGDMSADVNNDGTVNSLDITAYRDMVTRSNNRP
jgi:Ca2+-binding EF-hand superfamily protein